MGTDETVIVVLGLIDHYEALAESIAEDAEVASMATDALVAIWLSEDSGLPITEDMLPLIRAAAADVESGAFWRLFDMFRDEAEYGLVPEPEPEPLDARWFDPIIDFFDNMFGGWIG